MRQSLPRTRRVRKDDGGLQAPHDHNNTSETPSTPPEKRTTVPQLPARQQRTMLRLATLGLAGLAALPPCRAAVPAPAPAPANPLVEACPDEFEACMADATCVAISSTPSLDATACNANAPCAAVMRCASRNAPDTQECADETDACLANPGCAGILTGPSWDQNSATESGRAANQVKCNANSLCATWMQCMLPGQDAVPAPAPAQEEEELDVSGTLSLDVSEAYAAAVCRAGSDEQRSMIRTFQEQMARELSTCGTRRGARDADCTGCSRGACLQADDVQISPSTFGCGGDKAEQPEVANEAVQLTVSDEFAAALCAGPGSKDYDETVDQVQQAVAKSLGIAAEMVSIADFTSSLDCPGRSKGQYGSEEIEGNALSIDISDEYAGQLCDPTSAAFVAFRRAFQEQVAASINGQCSQEPCPHVRPEDIEVDDASIFANADCTTAPLPPRKNIGSKHVVGDDMLTDDTVGHETNDIDTAGQPGDHEGIGGSVATVCAAVALSVFASVGAALAITRRRRSPEQDLLAAKSTLADNPSFGADQSSVGGSVNRV